MGFITNGSGWLRENGNISISIDLNAIDKSIGIIKSFNKKSGESVIQNNVNFIITPNKFYDSTKQGSPQFSVSQMIPEKALQPGDVIGKPAGNKLDADTDNDIPF